jgi:hypothetical protein
VTRPPPAPVRKRNHTTARVAGKTAERVLVAWAQSNGAPHAERRVAGSRRDRGDVAGTPGLVIECKSPGAGSPITLAAWLDETMAERDNDNADIGLLVIKRYQRGSPGHWYWVTDGDTMARLLRAAGWWK